MFGGRDMWLEAILVNFLIHSVSKTSGFVNLAHTPKQNLQGVASWSVAPHDSRWTADKAVDGNISQTNYLTCAIAAFANNYKTVWWKVWLDRKFNIAYLEIYFRSDTIKRATGFSIYVYEDKSFVPPSGNTGSRVFHHNPQSGCPSSIQNITVNRLAHGVAFYNERPDGFTSSCPGVDVSRTSVEICEVRVMGCDHERYHFGCSAVCNAKCKNKHCDAFNGSCIYGCSNPGAVTINCTECDDGAYAFGGKCVKCGQCIGDVSCNRSTGICFAGCKDNWKEDLCNECADGYYDRSCSTKCGNCHARFCDKKNGSCLSGCKPNWQKHLCQECADGYYDRNCSTRCGNCHEGFCDKKNGSCSSGCKPNWQKPLCQECADGYYDRNCSTRCGNCLEGFCDKKNGSCSSGCKPNWQKPLCQVCADGYYDQSCSTKCGNCLEGFCDKKNGSCSFDCKPNWQKPLCQECVNGYYDRSCSTKCGNCLEVFCDKKNGSCLSGCKPNWQKPLCQECADGYYDRNCSTKCGNCQAGFCDKKNGSCLSGCKPNFQKPLCQECTEGHYDRNCSSKCGNCHAGFCDKKNGTCLSGCKPNWQKPLCQECVDGFYDVNCSRQCGQCLGGICDKKNGTCMNGCSGNWHEPLCQECAEGFYDKNCSTTCGNCREGFCDKNNGSCFNGCEQNWEKPLCQECVDGFYDVNCSRQCGQCLGGVCDKKNGTCMNGCFPNWHEPLCQECVDGFYDVNCSSQCGRCLGGICNKKNGTCMNGCLTNWQEPLCQIHAERQEERGDNRAIIGGTVSTLLLVALAGVIILIIYRRYRSNIGRAGAMENISQIEFSESRVKRRGSNGKENQGVEFDGVCDPETNQSDEEGYYNTVQFNTNISVGNLQNLIIEKGTGENNQFLQEYKKLPPADMSICQSAKKTENTAKNRFKTTFPYEHSRIILKEVWTDSDNDYINANFITDCNGEHRYIAAQGPKVNTLRDFWRMIWQEDIKDIVMLTNIIENGKNKCTQYWPNKDKSMEIGPCKIFLQGETEYAFYTVRKFSVERKHSSSRRIISQFHYTAWPDHGTPEELGLVQFHKVVAKRMHPDAPLLVHCSAGVGRTGTFIGLDSLLRQGRETGRINIFEFVKQMRENRMTMVQTPEQYVFLHKALHCGFQNDFILSKDEFPTKTDALLNDNAPLNQRALYKEFKFLLTLKPNHDHVDEDATKAENTSKNYSKDILPVLKYRPYLTSYVKGRNDYINAVFVPSNVKPYGLILTQKPLSDTEVDLWRLCVDHGVDALVVLNDNDEKNDWLPKRGMSNTCSPFTLTIGDTGSNICGVSRDSLVIASEKGKKGIELFQMQADDNDAVLKGTELLLEKEEKSSFTTVIISKDGAGSAGIFCVLHNALQQISMDGEVDIFTIVRQLKIRRPEVITKLEEYRRCYQLVSQSVSTEGIYANM